MKVSNVSIIKGGTIKSAILSCIEEHFSAMAVKSFSDSLDVSGNIGTCERVIDNGISEPYASVSYFVVSLLGGDFFRVEHCYE